MTPQNTDPSVLKAKLFATAAHAAVGQKRKYTFEPYITHPERVVEILCKHVQLKNVWDQRNMLAAAWLHDVVEDTQINHKLIFAEFGKDVADLVYWLTDASKGRPENRAVRKQMDLEHLKRALPIAKTIKLADLIDNTESIVKNDPEFAKVYLKEKRALLEHALCEGDVKLWEMADVLVYQGQVEVGQ